MYEHLVTFKFKEDISEEKKKELLDLLHGFKGVIPGMVDMSAGFNETKETENIHGYSLGLRVTFEDQLSLDQYGPHPAHQQFVQALDGLIDNVIGVDYPIRNSL